MKSNKTRKLPHPSELSAKARRERKIAVSIFGFLPFGFLALAPAVFSQSFGLFIFLTIIIGPFCYLLAKHLYYADIEFDNRKGYSCGACLYNQKAITDDLDPSNAAGLNNPSSLRSNLNINNPNNPFSQDNPASPNYWGRH